MTEGRVYVVDDDAAVRDSLEALLSSAGFATEGCGSAADFLSRIVSFQHPDHDTGHWPPRTGA